MFVDFGSGKCPVCGDRAMAVERDIFHCDKCVLSFNGFSITTQKELKDYHDKYWN